MSCAAFDVPSPVRVPDGTEAALIIHSPFGSQCGVLLNAWLNSK